MKKYAVAGANNRQKKEIKKKKVKRERQE